MRDAGARRFSCIPAGNDSACALLHGCPVTTAGGARIGRVKSLLVDAHTRQLRYVVLSSRRGSASLVIPWHALYFDSATATLVFYSCS
jgi:hypothetical protein